jgi:hypothetical protein
VLHSVGEYEAGLIERYRERRARLAPPPPRKAIIIPRAAKPDPEPEPIPDSVPVPLIRFPSWRVIIGLVELKHGVSFEAMKSISRVKRVLDARREAMALIYTHCGMSTTQIGRLFGGRDHSTICHAFNRIGIECRQPGSGK